MSQYPFCVYTIIGRIKLEAAVVEKCPLKAEEKKAWVKAQKYLNDARTEGVRVPVILSDAADCTELLYWGYLEKVNISDSGTVYEVDRLRPIERGHAPQELLLASSGKNIAPGFIRPYALCHTPDFLSESEQAVYLAPEEGVGDVSAPFHEGAAIRVTVNAYERNIKARQICLEHYGYSCAVCEFNFETMYGEIGKDFIHVHHIKPLAEIGEKYKVDPIADLRPVCPNCHAMLHKRIPAIKIEELKLLVER